MALLYVVSAGMAPHHSGWTYVRAFAEAAMVGGLADWFAVTALFRRPLGLPIPHTAVIPNSKDRIAEALGQFIVTNFLAPDLVERRLAGVDLAAGLARQLADQATAERVADGIASAIPSLLDTLDDQRVSDFLQRVLEAQAREFRAAPLIGDALAILTEQGRHQALVDAAIVEGWKALAENEAAFRARVRERTGWLWRIAGVDVQAADSLIAAVRETLGEIATTPHHPTRARITRALADVARDLTTSPDLQARIEAAKTDLLAHPAVAAYFEDVWAQAKRGLRAAAEQREGGLRQGLARGLTDAGEALLRDAPAREALNVRLRALLSALAARHGEDVARLVADTIRGWDARTITEKLEASVGRDLQYIRINGALVGGLVGLAIHAASRLLGLH
jgi:uncharacterized membrane-anchored protein YjiN (DUF445 family)